MFPRGDSTANVISWEYRRIGASALVTIHAYLALANPWNFEKNYGNSR
jgi:hypothetical protein